MNTTFSMPSHLDSPCSGIHDGRFENPQLRCPFAVAQERVTGRWFITIGHAGFNLPANNGSGYKTKASALAAYARCGSR